MVKSYTFKLEATRIQINKLNDSLSLCRQLYNAALEERITAYKKCTVSLNYYSQANSLKEIKEALPEYKEVHSQVLQEGLKRLEKAYKAFFRRVKQGAKAGFPRFQGKHRFDSFTYPQYKAVLSDEAQHIYLPKIANVRIRLSRAIEGIIKTCTVKRDACGDWFVTLTCDVEAMPLPKTGNAVGIDAGLTDIVATGEGERVQASKFFSKQQKALRKAQRRLARKKKGSANREKARLAVAKIHRKIARQGSDFLPKLSTRLVREYDLIALEDLSLKGLTVGCLPSLFMMQVSLNSLRCCLTKQNTLVGQL